MKRVIVIGAGLHYREKYHQVLENKEISLVIDLKSQEPLIRSLLKDRPKRYLFLEESYRNSITSIQISELVGEVAADCVLICTEPKVRAQYAFWAANQGYPMFLDKPATTTLSDFETLIEMDPYAVVSCERRAHCGYRHLFSIIDQFVLEYGVPLTSIDIHFAGGIWKTPLEYAEEENHPFRYGYGILMHSGYHYIDLLAKLLCYTKGDQMHLKTMCSTPEDYIFSNGPFEYPYLFLDQTIKNPSSMEGFGETDVMVIGQTIDQGHIASHFSLKMLGTSLSMRTKLERGEKLPGKIRQEFVILHFGHLFSIHIRSCQFKRIDPTEYPHENFTITLIRNPLLNKKRIEEITRQDLTQDPESLNSAARKRQLRDFFNGYDGNSSLKSHIATMQLLDKINRDFPCKILNLSH